MMFDPLLLLNNLKLWFGNTALLIWPDLRKYGNISRINLNDCLLCGWALTEYGAKIGLFHSNSKFTSKEDQRKFSILISCICFMKPWDTYPKKCFVAKDVTIFFSFTLPLPIFCFNLQNFWMFMNYYLLLIKIN